MFVKAIRASYSASRTYATHSRRRMRLPKSNMAEPSPEIAQSQSAPLGVRKRRFDRNPELKDKWDHTNSEGLTISESNRFHRNQALNIDPVALENEGDQRAWANTRRTRRQRLRGISYSEVINTKVDRKLENVSASGQKIFLPNIVFTMVRNNNPAGQPYNPYEATFRIPQSVTKTDIRSYLMAVYGVDVTYIRTDNYNSSVKLRRNPKTRAKNLSFSAPAYKTYKRAVVGLKEPFYYPEREEEKELESAYEIQSSKETENMGRIERFYKNTEDAWRWRGEPTTSRGKILSAIAQRREERYAALQSAKARMTKMQTPVDIS